MITRKRIAATVIAGLLGPATSPVSAGNAIRNDPGIVSEMVFVGLRRISPESLKYKMACHEGQAYSAESIGQDVRTLAQLGWFDTIRVESEDADAAQRAGAWLTTSEIARAEPAIASPHRVRLTFFVPELPFLTEVEYHGSRLISKPQIDKLLKEKKLAPRLGEPENRVAVHRVAKEIESALQELGHPQARVAVHEEVSEKSTVRVRYEIEDAPHVAVGRLTFRGNLGVSEKRLQRQMHELQPSALFAGLRGKDAYTPEHFEQDRDHLLAYYQNHGYPEARIGAPKISQYENVQRKWLPWPHRDAGDRLAVEIPVEAGPLYKFDAVQASESLRDAAATNRKPGPTSSAVESGQPYSAQAVENLRRAWQGQIRGKVSREELSLPNDTALRSVETTRIPDAATHTMGINFRLSDSPQYIVRRLQFEGIKLFPDRYFRKRIVLKEGAPFDERALEAGIARLGRTGYFKPIKKEDIHVVTDDVTRTADVTVRIEELGKQRISLMGGPGQFGSTLGIAYILYNILNHEELLSAHIEGGPEILELALGFAKEGFLGSRATLAFSVFNNLVRPQLVGTTTGPFFKQQTVGISADWRYALSNTDTVSVDFGISRSNTQYSLALPTGLTGLPLSNVSAASSSHSLGFGWERNTGSQQIIFADSASGGLLGGSENLLRTRAEYGHIVRDHIFNSQNAWAFRTSFSAVGSYSGSMPPYALGFAGDQYVRGLRDGELGPTGVVSSISSSGATTYSAGPAGANLITAVNLEYRMPLRQGTEAAMFFDLGSGRLLRNWLGPNRPSIFDTTNSLLHGSTGVELRWTVPGLGVPVRVYYAFNVLRLNRVLTLPDGSLFKASNRFSALGWGLGSLF
jgi:outer membrane protein assembly complex protein YaeT